MKYFSLYQINQLKLLRKLDGKPYATRAAVAHAVKANLKYEKRQTDRGITILVSESEIARWNKKSS